MPRRPDHRRGLRAGQPRLTGGAFTPSTVERFEQIKAALVEDGLLWEGEDGALAWTRRPDYPSLGVPE